MKKAQVVLTRGLRNFN